MTMPASTPERGSGHEDRHWFRLLAISLAPFVLAGCAALTSPLPAAGPNVRPFRIANWNLASLTQIEGGRCLSGSEADYAAARRMANELGADVIAFQQAQDEAAAERIFVRSRFIVIMERRRRSERNSCVDGAANVVAPRAAGIAVRRGLPFSVLRDFSALRLGDAFRSSGMDIVLRPHGRRPLRLLSLNLGVPCPPREQIGSCLAGQQEAEVIGRWMRAATRVPARFLILGWDRRFAASRDIASAGEAWDARLTIARLATLSRCREQLQAEAQFAIDRRAARDLRPMHDAPLNEPPSNCPVWTEIGL
ncbi:MAG: hypothetical protein AB7U35_15180 [Sphingobium sp.]